MVLAPPRPPRHSGPADPFSSPDLACPFPPPDLTGLFPDPDLAGPIRTPDPAAPDPAAPDPAAPDPAGTDPPGTVLDPGPVGPDLDPGPVGPAEDPDPAPAETAAEPDDIVTWYTRPERRRRRRRLITATAILTSAACAVVGLWRVSAPQRSLPARAYAPQPRSVILHARARQRRRRKRIAQAAAPLVGGAGGWAAAGGPDSRLWPRSHQHHRRDNDGPGSGGLSGINVFGWGCASTGQGVASDGTHIWEACSTNTVLEFDASTGKF